MNLALINIRQLVTVASQGLRAKVGSGMRDLGVVENAGIIVEGDSIAWCGKMEDLSMSSMKEAEVLDCHNRVVMPGFIDSHTHALFAGSREEEFALRSAGATYQEIASQGGGILSTMRRVRDSTKKDLKRFTRRALNSMLRRGTTTVEIKSGYGLTAESETKMLEAICELREEEVIGIVPTFLGAHAVPPEFAGHKDDYVAEIIQKMLPYVAQRHLAEFCDVFCEQGYFDISDCRTIFAHASSLGMKPKLHAEELSPLGGADFAASIGAVSADHLEHITDAGIAALAKAGVVATLLPGVSFFLNHHYAPARKLIDAGAPVAIATDYNPGSCMSYNMPLMMTIACTQMMMSPEEAIVASTLNAAAALNRSGEIGSIETGKKADLIVLNIPNYKFLPYHFGENHVEKVVKNGVILEF